MHKAVFGLQEDKRWWTSYWVHSMSLSEQLGVEILSGVLQDAVGEVKNEANALFSMSAFSSKVVAVWSYYLLQLTIPAL